MFKTIISFFETSIAYLSIYDVFIILLFILAVVLSIISGIIVVSSSVKKINVELTKNKNIQNINEKIIQNRLDLIINKLTETQKNTNNYSDLVDINNISNRKIKDVIDTLETSENEKTEFVNTSNVINLPSQKTLDYVESNTDNNELNTVTQPIENKENYSTTSSCNNSESDINTNIVLSPDKIPDSSKYSEETPIVSVAPATIQLNPNEVPKDIFDKNQDNEDSIIINIKDDSDKKIKLVVNTEEKKEESTDNDNLSNDNKNKNVASNYEDSNNIPLNFNKDLDSITNNEDLEEDGKIFYSDSKQKPLKGLDLANYYLNQIQSFTDDEKFEIANYISNSGNYINCLVNNKLIPINFNELNRQLLIQRLNYQYEYPLEVLETNYPIKLNHNSTKKCDLLVFDEDDNPHIICVINSSEEEKSLNKLYKLVNASKATFGILVSNKAIQYYRNFNGNFEEIDDIPTFNENLDNNQESTSSQLQFISTPRKNKLSDYQSRYHRNPSLNEKNNTHNPDAFCRDKYNIYRKNPYSVSEEYLSIMEKYRNLSANYKDTHTNLNSPYTNNYYNSNFSIKQNNCNPLPNNVRLLNLSNNKPRDPYMNRYTNIHHLGHPIINNMIPSKYQNNNRYQNNFMIPPNIHNYNHASMPGYMNNHPHVNINYNFPPRTFVPTYNNSMPPVNNMPMPHNYRPMPSANYMPLRIPQNNTSVNINSHPNNNNCEPTGSFKSYRSLVYNKAAKPTSPHLFNTNFKINKH